MLSFSLLRVGSERLPNPIITQKHEIARAFCSFLFICGILDSAGYNRTHGTDRTYHGRRSDLDLC